MKRVVCKHGEAADGLANMTIVRGDTTSMSESGSPGAAVKIPKKASEQTRAPPCQLSRWQSSSGTRPEHSGKPPADSSDPQVANMNVHHAKSVERHSAWQSSVGKWATRTPRDTSNHTEVG